MKIAICDDDKVQLKYLEGLLQDWAAERGLPLTAESFPSSEAFLFRWEKEKDWDLLILDIVMGRMNGMELARHLRGEGFRAPLLFITGFDEYMAQGYEVEALHYLLKPLREDQFRAALERALLRGKAEEKVCLSSREGQIALQPSEIWYAEARGHYCEVHTKERVWRHDYRNQMQTLKACLAMGKVEEAQAFIDQLEQDLSRAEPFSKSGNMAADAMLGVKVRQMQELEIPVDVTAHVPGDLPVSWVDLAALLGNLLDNATEACLTAPPEERFIRIYMDVIKRQFYISVTNAMAGKARRVNGIFPTTKGKSRGLGLIRMDQIVARYGGSVNRQSEQGVFATEITLPLSRMATARSEDN